LVNIDKKSPSLHAGVAGRLLKRSAQAANRGIKQKKNSADLAAVGVSVVREFLKSGA
jgi:hypothetical protein